MLITLPKDLVNKKSWGKAFSEWNLCHLCDTKSIILFLMSGTYKCGDARAEPEETIFGNHLV